MTLNELQNIYPGQGKVENLLVRPKRTENAIILDKVTALKDVGLEGDHYQNHSGARQVTLIQAEHLEVLAALLRLDKIRPEFTRRNIVIRGINLLSLKGKRFSIGEAVLEYSGECHPCSRMENTLGPGGYNAMRGHGGITAKVIASGVIKVGDVVNVLQTVPDKGA
jgi:MOSC domain-containing protein YiiM